MSRYIVSEAKSGDKTLSIKNCENERELRIHSAYDPAKEAERSVDGFSAGRGSVIIVSGIGLGYHLAALKNRFKGMQIIAVEQDREITGLCREINPVTLENIFIVHDENELAVLLDNLRLSGFRGVSHYIHRPSYLLNPDFYESMISLIRQNIASRISDLLTRFEFEERWIRNIFMNLRHVEGAIPVRNFFGKFKGYPGLIISAGPSLRGSLESIRGIMDRAVTVCVDTSYKVLEKAGISPHFVMTLDAQKYSHKHFTGMHSRGTLLVADMVACPSVLNNFDGRIVISSTSKYYQDMNGNTVRETTPGMDWIERYITPTGDIQSGGSVATSAFDLLLNMGCNPIILVGQDLAYTGREYHCSGTYHNDDWQTQTGRFKGYDTINQNVIRKRRIKYVPCYGGRGLVISDFVFDLYKSWFEDSAAKVNVKVINATMGGSMIKNTIESTIEGAVSGGTGRVTPSSVISSVTSKGGATSLESLKKAVIKINSRIDSILSTDRRDEPFEKKAENLNRILEDDEINSIFSPLVRKTGFYIARHSLDVDRTGRMLYDDLISAASKLKSFFQSTGWVSRDS